MSAGAFELHILLLVAYQVIDCKKGHDCRISPASHQWYVYHWLRTTALEKGLYINYVYLSFIAASKPFRSNWYWSS